jgi:hypothetical protein
MNTLRFIVLSSILFLASCIGCKTVSREEVTSVKSPDGRVEAALYETNGGATSSFEYEVELRQAGRRGLQVASIYGAVRNENAYGLNMKWNGNDELDIEYLRAKAPPNIQSTTNIDGRNVRVIVKDGITDPSAPSGGMLYNLKRK